MRDISYYATRMVSLVMLTRQINAIFDHVGYGPHTGLFPAEHYVARWSAFSLWVDVFMLRFGGYRSSPTHIAFAVASMSCILLIAFSQFAIVLTAAYVGMSRAAEVSNPLAFWLIVVPSVAAIHLSLVLPLIGFLLPMKFTFKEAPSAQVRPNP